MDFTFFPLCFVRSCASATYSPKYTIRVVSLPFEHHYKELCRCRPSCSESKSLTSYAMNRTDWVLWPKNSIKTTQYNDFEWSVWNCGAQHDHQECQLHLDQLGGLRGPGWPDWLYVVPAAVILWIKCPQAETNKMESDKSTLGWNIRWMTMVSKKIINQTYVLHL